MVVCLFWGEGEAKRQRKSKRKKSVFVPGGKKQLRREKKEFAMLLSLRRHIEDREKKGGRLSALLEFLAPGKMVRRKEE